MSIERAPTTRIRIKQTRDLTMIRVVQLGEVPGDSDHSVLTELIAQTRRRSVGDHVSDWSDDGFVRSLHRARGASGFARRELIRGPRGFGETFLCTKRYM